MTYAWPTVGALAAVSVALGSTLGFWVWRADRKSCWSGLESILRAGSAIISAASSSSLLLLFVSAVSRGNTASSSGRHMAAPLALIGLGGIAASLAVSLGWIGAVVLARKRVSAGGVPLLLAGPAVSLCAAFVVLVSASELIPRD